MIRLLPAEVRSELGVDAAAGCNAASEQVEKGFSKSGEAGHPSMSLGDPRPGAFALPPAVSMRYFVDSLSW